MSDWMLQLVGPVAGGAVTGLMLLAGLRVEVRNLKGHLKSVSQEVKRAHGLIADHERHFHMHMRKTDHA